MKFFIPLVRDDQVAEEVLDGTKKHLKEMGLVVGDRRTFRIRHKHEGKDCVVEVGQPHPVTGEIVVAILESPVMNLFLVCTPNRGVQRGEPILVGHKNASSVTDFE